MATAEDIQHSIDSCTQAAHSLRTTANTMICAMNRQTATMGAVYIEMCINKLVQAKMSMS